jgi:hypothetical protein
MFDNRRWSFVTKTRFVENAAYTCPLYDASTHIGRSCRVRACARALSYGCASERIAHAEKRTQGRTRTRAHVARTRACVRAHTHARRITQVSTESSRRCSYNSRNCPLHIESCDAPIDRAAMVWSQAPVSSGMRCGRHRVSLRVRAARICAKAALSCRTVSMRYTPVARACVRVRCARVHTRACAWMRVRAR